MPRRRYTFEVPYTDKVRGVEQVTIEADSEDVAISTALGQVRAAGTDRLVGEARLVEKETLG
jgi:hypothetical protein